MFFAGSAMAVYHFINNLRLAAKAQAKAPKRASITRDEINLDKNQQGYSDLAARYLLLFAVAIFSDSSCYFLAFGFSSHSGLRYFVMALDYMVNLSCVYLQ